VAAVGATAVIGVLALARDRAPAFPASPTAKTINVAATPQADFPVSDPQLRAALTSPPDHGPLADPERRASCLTGLGYAADLDILGARPLEVAGREGVLLLLPGATPDAVVAVVVAPSCTGAHADLLAQTVLSR
jgi:hypothetical protein